MVGALLSGALPGAISASFAADTPTITAPSAPTFALSTSGQDPGDFVISGFSSSATLNVSIGFVNPPSGVTFAMPSVAGLTPGFGYNFTGGKTQISFTGSIANANSALAAMTVSTGSTAGNITIRVTAYENEANLYYNPINGHYYKYVSRSNTYANSANTSQSAFHLAEQAELFGVKGYLATITTAQEQEFVYSYVSGNNIWIGASDDVELLNERAGLSLPNQSAAEGKWYWVSGPEAGTLFLSGAASSAMWIDRDDPTTLISPATGDPAQARYENFCTGNSSAGGYALQAGRSHGEPNNWGGAEHYILEKWSGSQCWNDYGTKDGNPQNAYLVEFSEDWGSGSTGWGQARGSFTSSEANPIATASISALADNAPKNVVATPGQQSATVTWQAPPSGTVSNYSVSSSPDSKTCNTSGTTCSISGLTAGTAYTFVVTATFNDSSTKTSLASNSITPTAASASSSNPSTQRQPATQPQALTPSPPASIPRTEPPAQPQAIQNGPVIRGDVVPVPPNAPTMLLGGRPTTVTTTVPTTTQLDVRAGGVNLGVKVLEDQGQISQSDDGTTEIAVRKGAAASITGSGFRPGATVQVFMPLQGDNAKELTRIPVQPDGSFDGSAPFATRPGDAPLPIGKNVLQLVSLDNDGNQVVVEMAVNIAQGAPAPEQNRIEGVIPTMTPGQSIATSGGEPVPVRITPVSEQKLAVVEGDGWTMAVNVAAENGGVEPSEGGALLKLVRDESVVVSGGGFMAGTRADVWLFSDPTLLGTVTIDENGEFTGEVNIDPNMIPVGEHTLQLQGVGEDGYVKAASLGVLVDDAVEAAPTAVEQGLGFIWWILAAIVLLAVIVVLLLWRRSATPEPRA